jgi:hypothetical protein
VQLTEGQECNEGSVVLRLFISESGDMSVAIVAFNLHTKSHLVCLFQLRSEVTISYEISEDGISTLNSPKSCSLPARYCHGGFQVYIKKSGPHCANLSSISHVSMDSWEASKFQVLVAGVSLCQREVHVKFLGAHHGRI